MPTVVIDHPLAAQRLATLREETTGAAAFRRALKELGGFLVYEATRLLPQADLVVQTPLSTAAAKVLGPMPVLVPVLRAGLGLLDAALTLLPEADVGMIGLQRDEETLLPASYLAKLPSSLAGRPALVLDPMLATGGSLVHTLGVLRAAGCTAISVCCVLAAPEGLAHLIHSGFGDVDVYTAAIDDHLDDRGFIVPGLGDAGDRQFGTL